VSLFKAYTAKQEFPIQKRKTEKGISITNGDIPFCRELIGATKGPLSEKGIDWSEQEAIDLFCRLLEWWDADKEFTKKDNDTEFFSVSDEFKKRFTKLTRILNQFVIPRLSPAASIREELQRLLNELSEYDIKCVATHAASLRVFPEQKQEVLNKIEVAILSKEKEQIQDGYNAIHQILLLHQTNKIGDIPFDICSYVELPIRWRCPTNLIDAMRFGIRILSDFPDTTTEKLLCGMLFGLEALIEETRLEGELSSMETVKHLDVRALAVSLAYALYKYYIRKGLPIPETLRKWRSISEDLEEFADVRNKWIISTP